MYNVSVAGSTASSTSYDGAKATAKANLSAFAENVRTNPRLFRSPKTRTAVAAAALRVVFPKKSGDVTKNVAGVLSVSILKA